MTRLAFSAVALLGVGAALFGSTAPSDAKGCLKGAVVGGVAGHYAGHHAVLGAVGGCIAGRHLAKSAAQKNLEQDNAAPRAGTPQPAQTAQ